MPMALMVGLAVGLAGCSRPQRPGERQPSAAASQRVLPPEEAAKLAARLANERCEQQYRKRPFAPEQHSASLTNGLYRWGALDVGGPGGFSALVTFRPDGSQPQVEVYYSSDALRPPKSPAPVRHPADF